MQEKILLTKEGLQNLREELKQLKEVKLPEVARNIQEARDHGDLSENALYDEAKREQAVVEGRIKELEDIIKKAEVIGKSEEGKVAVGSKVKLHLNGEEVEFHIVGDMEADPIEGKIGHSSPIGEALLGKVSGDKISIEAPMGTITYTILDIK